GARVLNAISQLRLPPILRLFGPPLGPDLESLVHDCRSRRQERHLTRAHQRSNPISHVLSRPLGLRFRCMRASNVRTPWRLVEGGTILILPKSSSETIY